MKERRIPMENNKPENPGAPGRGTPPNPPQRPVDPPGPPAQRPPRGRDDRKPQPDRGYA